MKNRLRIMMLLMASSALVLTACWSEAAVEADGDGASLIIETESSEDGEEEAEEVVATNGRVVKPYAITVDVNNPEDCILPAAFKTSDINTEAMEITYTMYNEDYYDAVEINMLQIGDTLVYDGEDMVVETIEDRSGDLFINGGMDMGGCELRAADGGTYVSHGANDIPTYSEVGRITLPIAESLEISDSINNPNAPVVAGYEDLEDYIEGLEEWSSSFSELDTRVEIRGGKVVAITRIWRP